MADMGFFLFFSSLFSRLFRCVMVSLVVHRVDTRGAYLYASTRAPSHGSERTTTSPVALTAKSKPISSEKIRRLHVQRTSRSRDWP